MSNLVVFLFVLAVLLLLRHAGAEWQARPWGMQGGIIIRPHRAFVAVRIQVVGIW